MIIASNQWFDVMSIVYYLLSFFVAGAISFLGYKAYKLIKENKYLNFAIAFLFIMLSFVVQALTNLFVYLNISSGMGVISSIVNYGFIAYALFTILGFFILVLLTFKINDVKVIAILTLGLIAALVLFNFIIMFHWILLVLALLLSYYFYKNCRQRKTTNSKLVFAAFLMIAISHIFHIASGTNEIIYVIGNTLLVLGYILLLITILRFK